MNVFIEILRDFKFYFNINTKTGRKHSLVLAVVLLASLVGYKLISSGAEAPAEAEATLAQVKILSVAELGASAQFDTIGKVEAVSEANLQTESGGRITSVSVKIGDTVGAGAILASIENSAQRAQLVQAQGSYEAALAASAQNNLSVGESGTNVSAAKNSLVTALRGGYNNSNSAVVGSMDQFFSNPNSYVPGLKINADGKAGDFNTLRVEFQKLLPSWFARVSSLTTESNLAEEAIYAKQNINKTILFCDMFIEVFADHEGNKAYTEAQLQAHILNFTTLKSSLLQSIAAIESAETQLKNAKEAQNRANLSVSGGAASASDAQVKIALGSLQAAQSSYQKTIVRTPIRGVVNAFYLKAGDYVSPGQPAAIIANNNGLQIKTFVNEIDSANLNVGDIVTIEGGAPGVITAKAAALDPTNGKVAVVVGVDQDSGLTNGATVKVTFAQLSVKTEVDKILVPLGTLKITSAGTFVFSLGDNNTLVGIPVTQGQLFGDNVEILSGISKDTRIITDARGLKEGQIVTVVN